MRHPREIRSLTGLRGLAAIYVVYFHFASSTSSTPFANFIGHGYLAVDLFFVLSGFVMAMNYQHMFALEYSIRAHLKFLGRRIARVYPLYFVCTLGALLLMLIGSSQRPPHCSSLESTLGLNLLMMQNWGVGGCGSLDVPGWSISAEWAAYLLFPVLLVPVLLRKPVLGWLSCLICVLTLAFLCLLPPSVRHSPYAGKPLDFSAPFYGLAIVRCVAEFVLGLLSYRLADTATGRKLGVSNWVAPVTSFTIIVLLTIPRIDLAVVLLFPLLIVSLASGTHSLNRLLSSPPFELLGVLSYSIYLTHTLLGGPTFWIQQRFFEAGLGHPHFYAETTRVVLLFTVAFLVHRLIEVPSRRWLRNWFEPDKHVVIREDRITTGLS